MAARYAQSPRSPLPRSPRSGASSPRIPVAITEKNAKKAHEDRERFNAVFLKKKASLDETWAAKKSEVERKRLAALKAEEKREKAIQKNKQSLEADLVNKRNEYLAVQEKMAEKHDQEWRKKQRALKKHAAVMENKLQAAIVSGRNLHASRDREAEEAFAKKLAKTQEKSKQQKEEEKKAREVERMKKLGISEEEWQERKERARAWKELRKSHLAEQQMEVRESMLQTYRSVYALQSPSSSFDGRDVRAYSLDGSYAPSPPPGQAPLASPTSPPAPPAGSPAPLALEG